MQAFATGCRGVSVHPGDVVTGVGAEIRIKPGLVSAVAVYGFLRGAGDVFRAALLSGVPALYIDHPYFTTGVKYSRFRVVLNSNHKDFGTPAQLPEFARGMRVLQIMPSIFDRQFPGHVAGALDVEIQSAWQMFEDAARAARLSGALVTTRTREAPQPLASVLRDQQYLLTIQSNCAIEAIERGVLPIVCGPHPLRGVTRDRQDIENRKRFARECEFTYQEFASGAAWEKINDTYFYRV